MRRNAKSMDAQRRNGQSRSEAKIAAARTNVAMGGCSRKIILWSHWLYRLTVNKVEKGELRQPGGNMLRKVIVFIACICFASCSSTSEGGLALGVRGSPAWSKTAPRQDVIAYYDAMKTYELCSKWDRAIDYFESDKTVVRRSISDSLVRRGEPEDRCYDADRDMIAVSRPHRNTYVPPVQPVSRPVNCTSSKIGNFVSTSCY